MNPQSENPPIEESKANEDEKTQKVKRSRKDREVKITPTSIKSLEDLMNYFSEEKPTKPQKIEILEIPSSILAEKFKDFKEFPTELKNLELIFTKDSFKANSDINLILQNILEKKSDLEVFKLTIYDVGVDLKGINFGCIKELKKLKTLKINVGLNTLDLETQNSLLTGFNGHPDLTNLALYANDCGLKDDFCENLHQKWFQEEKIQGKLKKLNLNLAKNSFKFEMNFNLDLLKQLFLRFERLEARFDGLEGRFDGLEGKFEGLESKFEGLGGKFAGLEGKFTGLEIQFAGLRGQLSFTQWFIMFGFTVLGALHVYTAFIK